MIVVLQHSPKLGRFDIRPIEESFEKALLGMKVQKNILDSFVLVVEIRDMIVDGAFSGRRGNFAKIYLSESVLLDREERNKAIAHELKHLALNIKRNPDSGELEFCHGFYRVKVARRYCWEERDAQRAEKVWGRMDYLFFCNLSFG